jgi:hypothetical protein
MGGSPATGRDGGRAKLRVQSFPVQSSRQFSIFSGCSAQSDALIVKKCTAQGGSKE